MNTCIVCFSLFFAMKRGASSCVCSGGVSDADCDQCRDSYRWEDGTNVRYHNWLPTEPNSPLFDCVLYHHNMGYKDSGCDAYRDYVCKRQVSWLSLFFFFFFF